MARSVTDVKLAATLRRCIKMDCGKCPVRRMAPADGTITCHQILLSIAADRIAELNTQGGEQT